MQRLPESSSSSGRRCMRGLLKVRTGCKNCKLRKKKCDEARPSCRQCVKLGMSCHRFDDPWNTASAHSASPPALLQRPAAARPDLMGSANLRDLLYLTCAMYKQGFTAAATGAGFHGAGGAYNGYLFSRGAELMSYASHLPSRCGIEPVLDMAVECIVAVLLEASRHAGTPTFGRTLPLPPRVILTYTLALVELQRALGDEKRSGSREILCATQLLALFECLRGENTDAVHQHVAGVTRLMQFRGAKQFNTGFDYSLLCSQLPLLGMRSVYQLKSSLLESTEWLSVLGSAVSQEVEDASRSHSSVGFYRLLFRIAADIRRCVTYLLHLPVEQQIEERAVVLNRLMVARAAMDEGYIMLLGYEPPKTRGTDNSILESSKHGSWRLYVHLTRLLMLILGRFYVGLGGDGILADAASTELKLQEDARALLRACPLRPVTYSEHTMISLVRPGCQAVLITADGWTEAAQQADASVLYGAITPIVSREMCLTWLQLNGFQVC